MTPWPLDRVLGLMAEAGYDGVEIKGFRSHPADYDTPAKCQQLRRQIEAFGLGISGYVPSFFEVPPALVQTDAYPQVFRKCLAFCANCGITTLRVDSVSRPTPLTPSADAARFCQRSRTWHAAAQEAARAGVQTVWEFQPGFWLNKPSEVMRLAEAVEHANFKLLFDTSHAYMGALVEGRQTGAAELLPGGVAEYGRRLAARVGHFHLTDSDGSLHNNETSNHTAFGEGRIDFMEVLSALQPVVGHLPRWCVDFCFNPLMPIAGKAAVPFVRRLMQGALV